MGSCASTHKPPTAPAMKLVTFGSTTDSVVILESPRKENSVPANAPAPEPAVKEEETAENGGHRVKSRLSYSSTKKSFGSKEETFFDTRSWIESDCDDDFHSVRGDFTPSRGNTPKHSFSDGFPRVNSPFFEEKLPGFVANPPPVRRRKKLAELFRDSIREEREDSENNHEDSSVNQSEASKKSAHSTPYVSVANSSACSRELGLNANGDSLPEAEKPYRSMQRCLPNLVSCGSFSERKKKMNPTIAVK